MNNGKEEDLFRLVYMKMEMKRIVLPLLLMASTTLSAQQRPREYTPSPVAGTAWNEPGNANPFIPGYFADPTIRKFGDTYYLYATTDGTGNGYGPAQVWVSKDFVNWKNIVMNWPTTEVVWAPDVVLMPNGKYRYFYCEPCNINIGESDSPIGPWHNILGKEDAVMVPDRYVHNVITLDPQLFVDDDKSQYLYFTTWGIYKGFGASWTVRFQKREGQYNNADGIVENYAPVWLLDGSVFWQSKHLRVSADCTNITNTRYYDYGGILQPGAWAKVSIKAML